MRKKLGSFTCERVDLCKFLIVSFYIINYEQADPERWSQRSGWKFTNQIYEQQVHESMTMVQIILFLR